MGLKDKLLLSCDIGAHLETDAKMFDDFASAEKAGWRRLNFDGIQDRSFIERIVCPHCWQVICRAAEKDIGRFGNK